MGIRRRLARVPEWDNEIQCNKCDRYRPSTQATCPGMFNTWRDGRITAVLCSGNEHLQRIRRRLTRVPEWDNEIQCNKCDRYRPRTQATCPGMFNTWRDGRITAVFCSGNEHLQKIRRRLARKPSAEFQEAMQTFYDRHGKQMNTADLIAMFGNLSQ